jgi:hypothetical protein
MGTEEKAEATNRNSGNYISWNVAGYTLKDQ